MLPQEIIVAKRDGGRLAPEAIRALVEGLTSGTLTEGQAAAFAMAVFFRGMDLDERVALTLATPNSFSKIVCQVLCWLARLADLRACRKARKTELSSPPIRMATPVR